MRQTQDWQFAFNMFAQPPFKEKRAHPRFLFPADAEITLGDGTLVPTQLDELSARGCFMGALNPIAVGTKFRLRIWDGLRTCELEGKVIYVQPGNKLGISGMGVLFGDVANEQRSVIDTWLHELASKQTAPPC